MNRNSRTTHENIFLLSSRIKENTIPFIFLVSLVNAEIGYERSDTRQDIGIPRRCDAAPVLIVTNAAQIKECRDKDLNWKFWWRLTITTWSSLLYDMFDTIDFKLVYEKTYITIHNIHYITLEFLTIICRSINKY